MFPSPFSVNPSIKVQALMNLEDPTSQRSYRSHRKSILRPIPEEEVKQKETDTILPILEIDEV